MPTGARLEAPNLPPDDVVTRANPGWRRRLAVLGPPLALGVLSFTHPTARTWSRWP
jgi:hypothetical protein